MESFIPLLIIPVVLWIGFDQVKKVAKLYQTRMDFLTEFWNKITQYVESRGGDTHAYDWLMQNADKMQAQLGIIGLLHFKPAYASYVVNNYHIIINGLPELRQMYQNHDSDINGIIPMMRDALLREKGVLTSQLQTIHEWEKKPLVWIREGTRIIVSLPINLLKWFGLINEDKATQLSNSPLVKVLTLLFALIGFLGTVVTLVTGWDSFIQIVKRTFNIP